MFDEVRVPCALIPPEVFIKSFGKSGFPQKSVDLSSIIAG